MIGGELLLKKIVVVVDNTLPDLQGAVEFACGKGDHRLEVSNTSGGLLVVLVWTGPSDFHPIAVFRKWDYWCEVRS